MALESTQPLALWVIPVPGFGGVARHVVDTARAGLPGYELVVLVQDGALAEALERLGTRVICGDFGPAAGFLSSYQTLSKLIADLRPAVVHSHLAYADIISCAVIASLRVKKVFRSETWVPQLVTTEHGIAADDAVYHSNQLKAQGRAAIHRLRLMATDRAIAVSASTAEQMKLKWGARQVAVIPNGVDIVQIREQVKERNLSSKAGPRILSLSRLAPEKGLDVLIDAFAELKREFPEATLTVAGQGELLQNLQNQAKGLGLSESISFPGFIDPIEAMANADLLVQLSQWENLSYTLLDAKAAGLRVVATDVGGNGEILSASELVSWENNSSPTERVHRVLDSMRKQLGVTPEKDFEWLSTEQMAQNIAKGYAGENQA